MIPEIMREKKKIRGHYREQSDELINKIFAGYRYCINMYIFCAKILLDVN